MIPVFVLILSVVCSVTAHTKYATLDNVKYSYGIFAPLGITVGGYIWYIGALGLVLGALVLLIFNKGWKTGTFDSGLFFDRRSFDLQRAFGDNNIIDDLKGHQRNASSHKLFWDDRISRVAANFEV